MDDKATMHCCGVLSGSASSQAFNYAEGRPGIDCMRMHEHYAKSVESEYVRGTYEHVGLYVYGQFYGKCSACACSPYQAFPTHN